MKKLIKLFRGLLKGEPKSEKEPIEYDCICDANSKGGTYMGWCHKHKTDWM